MILTLPSPLNYFPVSKNPFEFKAGLRKLSGDLSDMNERVFQIDADWPRYRENKQQARLENLSKYVCSKRFSEDAQKVLSVYILEQLQLEYPQYFRTRSENGHLIVLCELSGDKLVLDEHYRLLSVESNIFPLYENTLDALCSQVQEDFSYTLLVDDKDTIAYLHLCAPNYWAARDKIGQCFLGAHHPVPDMDKINRQSKNILTMMAEKGPLERFTWGLTTDQRLNHHPQPPKNEPKEEWCGRQFDPDNPELYLRVERQITVPFPKEKAFLFTIRTYFSDVKSLDKEQLLRLRNAVDTMSEGILKYKGLAQSKAEILRYLDTLSGR